MPPRMKFRLSHTGDVTSEEQPQHLSAPPTADASVSTKIDRNIPESILQKNQVTSLDESTESAATSSVKPVTGKIKINSQV